MWFINRETDRDRPLAPDILKKIRVLRQAMYNMYEIGSMELMLKNILAMKTNVEFFDMMRRGG